MKAVLVIDVPEDVTEVICAYDDREGFTHQRFLKIRPLPQMKETDGHEPFEVFMHREGWNECIDAITGETE